LHDALQTAMTEAGACASAKDVQAFVATHLAERISARKRTIQIALEAAVHRDKLAAVLKSATLESTGAIAMLTPAVPVVVPLEATSRTERPAHTDITRREGVTSVDQGATTRVINDAVANGSSVPLRAPLDSATIEPPRERPPVRRIWLALVLALGIGSILGTLIFARPGKGVTSSSRAAKVVDSVGTSAPVQTSEAPSASPPAPSSTESTRKGVVPLPGALRPRLSPRSAATSPRRVTGDEDGI
jgi:hypothetical protein